MPEHRVAVTGLGAVTPIGLNTAEFWQALVEGKSGISRIKSFDATFLDSQIAGQIEKFNPLDKIPLKSKPTMSLTLS